MNANKLKDKLVEKGFTVAMIANLMDIHKSSLYEKINGCDHITIQEAKRLKDILELTNLEALDIFLSKE